MKITPFPESPTSPSKPGPCPLCGELGRYSKDVAEDVTHYVVDCLGCRQLRIPSAFLSALWDMKEPERRAVGRLLLGNRLKYGPSLELDAERYGALVNNLSTRGRTPTEGLF